MPDTPDLPNPHSSPNVPSLPKARAGVETYIVPDGSCFLYDPASDASYALDQVGALVWDYCDGATSVSAMVAEVAELLPDDSGVAARVTGLLRDFASERLLEASDDWPTASVQEMTATDG